jgi:hypothetical protein
MESCAEINSGLEVFSKSNRKTFGSDESRWQLNLWRTWVRCLVNRNEVVTPPGNAHIFQMI